MTHGRRFAHPPHPEAIPLSLYVHWPWCVRKCPYCDFNSRRAPKLLDEEVYVDRLLAALDRQIEAAGVRGRTLRTIFIGGGTPSLMTPETVGRLLEGAAARIRVAGDCEVTMEANPGTADAARFAGFRAAGVNRLSLGVQSLSTPILKRIGRIHDADGARAAIRAARSAFENFNLDFMFALPGQTLEELEDEVAEALDSGASHLSFYQLTLEPGTAFGKRPPEALPDEDAAAEMGDMVESRLALAGFERYEVSGYAKPGRRCRHNLNYWTFGDYLGVGAGAHAKWTNAEGVWREAGERVPSRWAARVDAGGTGAVRRRIPLEDLPFEFMLNALRLVDGVPSVSFRDRTGLELDAVEPVLGRLRAEGLMADDPGRLAATPRGLRFLSDLQEAFL